MDDFEFPEMPHVYLPAVNADDGLTRWEFLRGRWMSSRSLKVSIKMLFSRCNNFCCVGVSVAPEKMTLHWWSHRARGFSMKF